MDIDKATESSLAKAINKIVLPALATVAVGMITWMVQDMRTNQQKQGEQIAELKTDVSLLNAKVDSGVLWRITEIERRLNHVEQAQKTP